jgi:hypothetical protein
MNRDRAEAARTSSSSKKNGNEGKEPLHVCGEINGVMGKGAFSKEGDKFRCVECGKPHDELPERYLEKIGEWYMTLRETCPKCGAPAYHIQRLLVPPIQTKNYADPAINYLWFEALRILQDVDEIIVIGYSLPPTDFASEVLFREGISGNAREEIPVTVINPDKRVYKRFSQIFGPRGLTTIVGLGEYLGIH